MSKRPRASAQRIWQDLVADFGFTGSYSAVNGAS